MTIGIPPEVEKALIDLTKERRIPPYLLAIEVLQEKLGLPRFDWTPRNEWEEKLLSAAHDCGVSLTDEAVSRDSLYEN
jgi:hypothetical protein